MSEIIDNDSVTLLRNYLDNPSSSTLTPFQKKLCDVSQNGRIEQEDLTILEKYEIIVSGDMTQNGDTSIIESTKSLL